MRIRHLLLCVAVAALFYACDRNTTYTQEIAGPSGCSDCHVPGDLITAKHAEWAESVHGTGEAYLRGTSAGCAGCHAGNGFVARVKAGLDPDEVTAGEPAPTRQDCRTCHQIHETYTANDWELRTEKPVTMYAVTNATFNGGEGNLCVNCHQPRREFPTPDGNGMITGISTHWGPHHGPQSAMILGVAGAGVTGTPHQHYGVPGTCVQCHMGIKKGEGGEDVEGDLHHTWEPVIANCQLKACHPNATNFDIDGKQTEILALVDQLGAELVTRQLINENGPDGHPIVTQAPEDEAIALWNWLYVAHEDKSNGVHNYPYAKALLEEGLTRLGITPAVASK